MSRYRLQATSIMNPGQTIILPFCKKDSNENTIFVEKVDLPVIDMTTLKLKNIEIFLQHLKQGGFIDGTMYTVDITYKHGGMEKKLKPVFDDVLLLRCAKATLSKTTNLENIPDFQNYANKIFTYMGDPHISKLMLQDTENLIPYMIKISIDKYFYLKRNACTRQNIMDLEEIKKSVMYTMQNYKNLRGMKVWDFLYKNGFINEKKPKALCASVSTILYSPSKREESERDPDEFAFFNDDELKEMAGSDEAQYSYSIR